MRSLSSLPSQSSLKNIFYHLRVAIRPVIHVSAVNDELISAVGKLAAEYGKIGGSLNQIASCLNEYGAPYPQLAKELRGTAAEHRWMRRIRSVKE